MKRTPLFLALLLPLPLGSCATPDPVRVFHNTDNAPLVVQSLDDVSAQVVAPPVLCKGTNTEVLDRLRSLDRRPPTAVIILEGYTEPQLGHQFRDRSVLWFMSLRGLGYKHIVFVQGKGTAEPDGLAVLAEYE